MPISKRLEIEIYAERCVTHLFATMINPKFRGPNFKFATFDIERHVESGVGFHFLKPLSKNETQLLRRYAKYAWLELLRLSGMEEPNALQSQTDAGGR